MQVASLRECALSKACKEAAACCSGSKFLKFILFAEQCSCHSGCSPWGFLYLTTLTIGLGMLLLVTETSLHSD